MPRIERNTPETPAEPAVDAQGHQLGEMSADQLSSAAASLGLNLDSMNEMDREVFTLMAQEGTPAADRASTIEELLAQPPASNPLIPDASADDFPSESSPTETGADGNGVGPQPEATAAGASIPTGEGAPVDTAPEPIDEPVIPFGMVPGLASPIPPSTPEPLVPATVDLGNGMVIPLDMARQLVQQQLAGTPSPQSPPGAPSPTIPTNPWNIDPEQYVDQQAAADLLRTNATVAQLQEQQRQMAEVVAQRQQMETLTGIDAGVQNYVQARGITEQERDQLIDHVTKLGLFPQYLTMYPGDPKSAIEASLEMAYWSNPDLRQRTVQQLVADEKARNALIDEKKANAAQVATGGGSAPRLAPAQPRNREEADAGLVGAIAAAINNGQG